MQFIYNTTIKGENWDLVDIAQQLIYLVILISFTNINGNYSSIIHGIYVPKQLPRHKLEA